MLAEDPGVNNRLIGQAVRWLKAPETMITEAWSREFNLDTPAGNVLKKLVSALPSDRALRITLFGSSPLQISICAELLSGDVDLFSDEEELSRMDKPSWPG